MQKSAGDDFIPIGNPIISVISDGDDLNSCQIPELVSLISIRIVEKRNV